MAGVPIANSLVEVHGTDAGMMTGVARAIATVSALMMLITACERAETLPVRVESLEENLAALRDAARAWRPDAYLESASLRLLDEGSASYLIWANFNSPSEMYESLAVRLLSDGSISVETYGQSEPVTQTRPITDDDWQLDSTEALERALDDEGRRYVEELSGLACSHLVLARSGREEDGRVVWRLTLADCLEPWFVHEAIVDAMSGEVISREVHTPPTPMPVPGL